MTSKKPISKKPIPPKSAQQATKGMSEDEAQDLRKLLEAGKTTLAAVQATRGLASTTTLRDALLSTFGVERVGKLSAEKRAEYRKLIGTGKAPEPKAAAKKAKKKAKK